MLLTRYSPFRRSPPVYCYTAMPLDLHVLGLSLAFILSQDQTLRCKYLFRPEGLGYLFECSIPSTLRFTLSIDGKAKTELITNYKSLITLASHCSTFVLTDLSVRLCTTCFILVSIVQRALRYRFQNSVGTVFLSFSGCKDSGCGKQNQIYFPLFFKLFAKSPF